MVSYKQTLLKVNNNFPAEVTIYPTLYQSMLTISFIIFDKLIVGNKAKG